MIKCIEKMVGNVLIRPFNILLENTEDMEAVEYWEERLEHFNEPHAVAYCVTKKGKVLYSIYCNTRKKGSVFR